MKRIPAGILALLFWVLMFGVMHMLLVMVSRNHLETGVFIGAALGGVILILLTRKMPPAWQAFLGGIAGLAFWAAFGEIGKAGELWETPAIWGVVAVVMIYFILQPTTRCDLFQWLRKPLGIHDKPQEDHWHAPAVALSFFMVTWVGHMEELTAYYHPSFGVHSWLTNLTLAVTLAVTPVLLWLLWKSQDWATAWGRAIPSVVIIWMWVEILMKWQVIPKPWG